jgi:hypothetical protein
LQHLTFTQLFSAPTVEDYNVFGPIHSYPNFGVFSKWFSQVFSSGLREDRWKYHERISGVIGMLKILMYHTGKGFEVWNESCILDGEGQWQLQNRVSVT